MRDKTAIWGINLLDSTCRSNPTFRSMTETERLGQKDWGRQPPWACYHRRPALQALIRSSDFALCVGLRKVSRWMDER
jgi:hypothetical protein